MKRLRISTAIILLISFLLPMAASAAPNTSPGATSPASHEYTLNSPDFSVNYQLIFKGITDYGLTTSDKRMMIKHGTKNEAGTNLCLEDMGAVEDLSKVASGGVIRYNAAVIYMRMPLDGVLGHFTYDGSKFAEAGYTVAIETAPYVFYDRLELWVPATPNSYAESGGNILAEDGSVNSVAFSINEMIGNGVPGYDFNTDKLLILFYVTVNQGDTQHVKHGPFAVELQPGAITGGTVAPPVESANPPIQETPEPETAEPPETTENTDTNEPVPPVDYGASPWAVESVISLMQKDILPPDLTTDLKQHIARDEFVAMIVAAWEYTTGEYLQPVEHPFEDLDDSIYEETIARVYSLAVINGVDETTFNPYGYITRQEAAAIISRLIHTRTGETAPETEQTTFSDDAEISPWAKSHVTFANEKEIMYGVGENKFSPKEAMTREQAAVIINRVLSALVVGG